MRTSGWVVFAGIMAISMAGVIVGAQVSTEMADHVTRTTAIASTQIETLNGLAFDSAAFQAGGRLDSSIAGYSVYSWPDDPNVIFAAVGDTAIGSTGAIQRSTDAGKTWETRPLPVEPNSNIWSLATHPADPNYVLAASLLGEIYTSSDAGDSWQKLKREFSEVGAMAWVPN